MEEKIKCPACGSEQISANQRGWSWGTGFIGSGKIIITCLKCGHRFKPGQNKELPKESGKYKSLELIVGLCAAIIFLFLIMKC